MLSRIAANRHLASALVMSTRSCAVKAKVPPGYEVLVCKEGPERDLINFPRLKVPQNPGKVRLGFVPEEWFQFFYPKTGVTGPYILGTGILTFLYSKEWMVMDHEFYVGITFIIMFTYVQKKYGKQIAEYLDKEMDAELEAELEGQREDREALEDDLKAEAFSQESTVAAKLFLEAQRENVALQLEAAYRKWQMDAYTEVKKRLDYQLELINIQRRLQQKHMVDWIVSNVQKSISGQQEKDMLTKCISDLKLMAGRA